MKNQSNTDYKDNKEITKNAQEKQQECFSKAQMNYFNAKNFEYKFLSLCLGKK